MEIDLQKLKKLAERATPGPYRLEEMIALTMFGGDDNQKTYYNVYAGDNQIAEFDDAINIENNAAYIAVASPDVVLALIEEVERLRAREVDYRQYLAGIRQGLELREADEKENEKELEKALDEIERLKKLSELWKHDYEELAASASDARKKNERLEKEADWLVEILGIQEEPCVKHFFDNVDCGAVTGCKECWREAARKAISEGEQCQKN